MKIKLLVPALLSIAMMQVGCMSSPVTVSPSPTTSVDVAMMGLGSIGGALIGQSFDDTWGAPLGAAVGVAGTSAYIKHAKEREAKLVAEAKEEARREERAILMRDYWYEATGAEYVGDYSGVERDVRYEAGVYDGVRYETRNLPRQLYLQEPAR